MRITIAGAEVRQTPSTGKRGTTRVRPVAFYRIVCQRDGEAAAAAVHVYRRYREFASLHRAVRRLPAMRGAAAMPGKTILPWKASDPKARGPALGAWLQDVGAASLRCPRTAQALELFLGHGDPGAREDGDDGEDGEDGGLERDEAGKEAEEGGGESGGKEGGESGVARVGGHGLRSRGPLQSRSSAGSAGSSAGARVARQGEEARRASAAGAAGGAADAGGRDVGDHNEGEDDALGGDDNGDDDGVYASMYVAGWDMHALEDGKGGHQDEEGGKTDESEKADEYVRRGEGHNTDNKDDTGRGTAAATATPIVTANATADTTENIRSFCGEVGGVEAGSEGRWGENNGGGGWGKTTTILTAATSTETAAAAALLADDANDAMRRASDAAAAAVAVAVSAAALDTAAAANSELNRDNAAKARRVLGIDQDHLRIPDLSRSHSVEVRV